MTTPTMVPTAKLLSPLPPPPVHDKLTWKPLKPDTQEGKHDFVVLNEWISQVDKYVDAPQLEDPEKDYNGGDLPSSG